MLLLTDSLIAEYKRAYKGLRLDEVLNTQKYTVSQTPLSYRQVNDLDENKLLNTERKSETGWRKFSFKELVYVEVISTLKEFGLKREQLKPLFEAFFKPPTPGQVELNTKTDAEMAIGSVFAGLEITLIADNQGRIIFSDPLHMILPFLAKPQIKIPLNDAVNDVLVRVGLHRIPVQYTLRSLIFNNSTIATAKEKELLNIIRNKEYSAVSIKKKDGVIATVYAEQHKAKNEMTTKELFALLNTKDYMDIVIVKRDGKIVNYKLEETIKL